MKELVLVREDSSDQGTFGRLFVGDKFFYTGELPWEDNKSNVSCIPTGSYMGQFTHSPRFGRLMYLILSANGRSGIRIHPANLMGKDPPYRKQLAGCIALGKRLGWIEKQKAVLISRTACREFETLMAGEPFKLEICNGYF